MATSRVLCKYYISNACTKGDGCPFSHNMKDKPDMTCRYYQMGACIYGNTCRYNHVRGNKEMPAVKHKIITEPLSTRVKMPGPITLAACAGLNKPSSEPEMVTLKKNPTWKPSEWVKAPEFVPGQYFHTTSTPVKPPPLIVPDDNDEYFFSYCDITMSGLPAVMDEISTEEASFLLCPFYEMTGQCPWEIGSCEYIHGDLCDMCQRYCLNPFDDAQQKEHKNGCTKTIVQEMEQAFAVQRSQGQTCGICMDVVLEKTIRSERRFGILSGCDHCFCLGCIRKWRNSTLSNKQTIRACPLCRNVSYIVIPSEVWIIDQDEKDKLMNSYKVNLHKKPCKYFDEGEGTCPFGNSCLYKHALPDGTLVESLPRTATDKKGRTKLIGGTTLWQFIEDREEQQWEEYSDDDDEY